MKTLTISEKFYSIQGEGQTMGIPAIFLRLAGCNLLCKSKNWVCDSIEVWQKGTKTTFENIFTISEIHKLKQGVHLVITGGEPLLHKKAIKEFIYWFYDKHLFYPIIEIETNGTIKPNEYLLRQVSFWNVSPKLESSGESLKKRFNRDAIIGLDFFGKNVIFKFVISKRMDVVDMLREYKGIIDFDKIVLMPAGETQNKLNRTRLMVVKEALKLGVSYSDRLQITIWNKKTGV